MNYVYEEGITIEIKEVFFQFQQEGKVKKFVLVFDQDTNHYKVMVTVREGNLAIVDTLFESFFRFIAYSDATLTVRKETEQGIHYEFASFSEQRTGFYCEVTFITDVTSIQEEAKQKEHGDTVFAKSLESSDPGLRPVVKWKFKVDSASSFPLIAAQGIIYAACEDGNFYAIDAEQGALRWQWKPNQSHFLVTSLPEVDNGVLYVPIRSFQQGKYETFLYSIAIQSGQVLKSFPIPSLRSTNFNILMVHNGVAYLSGADCSTITPSPDQHGICLAIDLQTEEQKWLVDLGMQVEIATPVITNRRVYLTTFDPWNRDQLCGHIHALDAQTGEEIWRYPFERRGGQESIVAGTDVFVVSTTLEVLDANSGTLQWNLPDLNTARNGPLTVSDEMIYISYQQSASGADELTLKKENEILLAGGPPLLGRIMAMDRVSKELQWRVNLVSGRIFIERPMISGITLYTTWKNLDMRGIVAHATLFALDVHTGQESWRFEAADLSAPLAANDLVFIRGMEGEEHYIYALFC